MADPKEFDFRETLKGHLTEEDESLLDKIDLEGFKKTVDENYVNSIVSYRTNKAKESYEKELAPKVQENILKELGIEGNSVEAAKAWAKRLKANTTEKDEIISKLENEKNEYSTYKEKYQQTESELNKYKTLSEMNKLGVKPEYQEDVFVLANSRITEEKGLEDVVKEMRQTHANFFQKTGAGGRVDQDDDDGTKTWKEQEDEWRKKYVK